MEVKNKMKSKNENYKQYMGNTGITRKVDDLGRITIPKEVRDEKRIFQGTPLQIYVEGDKIIIENIDTVCSFCNKKKVLYEFKEKMICKKCIKDIKESF